MSFWWALFKSIPEIVKLLTDIEKAIEQMEIDAKVKNDTAKLKEAFSEKDPAKLKAIFNS